MIIPIKNFIILSLFFLLFSCHNESETVVLKLKKDPVTDNFGYVDSTGLVKIDYKFGRAEEFVNGLAIVSYYGERERIININGEFVYESTSDINYINRCYNGKFSVMELPYDSLPYSAILSSNGNLMFKLTKYLFIEQYTDKLYKGIIRDNLESNRRVDILNESGKILIHEAEDVNHYMDYFWVQRNYKHGIADSLGNMIIPIVYDTIIQHTLTNDFICKEEDEFYVYSGGGSYKFSTHRYKELSQVKHCDNLYKGVIRRNKESYCKDPKEYFDFMDDDNIVVSDIEESITLMSGNIKVKKNNKYGVINCSGKNILDIRFDQIELDSTSKYFICKKWDEVSLYSSRGDFIEKREATKEK